MLATFTNNPDVNENHKAIPSEINIAIHQTIDIPNAH
jgi:hypothetical protein